MSDLASTLRQLAAEAADHTGPIQMLNMIRYREQAEYPEGLEPEDGPISGAEAYRRYGELASVQVAKVGGEQVWYSSSNQTIIGPADEEWDAVFSVRYPNRQAFLDMVYSADYQAVVHHREAAVADSRLILHDPRG